MSHHGAHLLLFELLGGLVGGGSVLFVEWWRHHRY